MSLDQQTPTPPRITRRIEAPAALPTRPLPPAAMPPRQPGAAERERRDALVPLVLLALAGAALAVIIALTSAQSSGTATPAPAVRAAAAPAPAATGLDALPDARPGNYDMTATRYDPVTRPVAAGPKVFDITTEERRVRVGTKVYDLWTINKTVPGPVLRAVVGDRVTVRVHNGMSSRMFHSMDFHASRLSMGGGYVQVGPGKTGSFTFTAEYPGVFMYHCATAPVLEHLAHGMYGMLIVQPKEGFGPRLPEYALLQSELYANFNDAKAGHEAAVVFNGIPNQYTDTPIRQRPNAKVRVFFLNAGPSKLSSFHVVGSIFDRSLLDGNPRNATYGRQALPVPASGSAVIEMQLMGEGKFPFVTHQFDHVSEGAVGLFVTGDGAPGALRPDPAMAHMAH